MGIQKLFQFLSQKFPRTITTHPITHYTKKTLAYDASNMIYQFLIKTQHIKNNTVSMPTDASGNSTGHLIGLLSRVRYCMENGVHVVWVFDGQPPDQKYQELKRRKQAKTKAEQKMEEAIQGQQTIDLLKYSQRSVKITKTQKQSAVNLIKLIGLPVIQSPSQAEAQCSELAKSGLVHGVISEDMDNLAFGCPRLIRNFNKNDDSQIVEVELAKVLEEMKLSYEQFLDFCILCGCDYSSKIKNIGPGKAYDLIKKHENIDNILEFIAQDEKMRERFTYDDQFNHFVCRKLFKKPEIRKLEAKDISMGKFQEQELIDFLINRQFNQKRISNWLENIKKTKFFQENLA